MGASLAVAVAKAPKRERARDRWHLQGARPSTETHTGEDMAHWKTTIPALPLARGVPVTDCTGTGGAGTVRGVVIATEGEDIDPAIGEPVAWVVLDDWAERATGRIIESPWSRWRVDLDDPQGYAYAMRWLLRRYTGLPSSFAEHTASTFWLSVVLAGVVAEAAA